MKPLSSNVHGIGLRRPAGCPQAPINVLRKAVSLLVVLFAVIPLSAQIDNNGCVGANFGVDAGLYSGVVEYGDGSPAAGTNDWFAGSSGRGVIDMTQSAAINSLLTGPGNPIYEARMNAGLHSIYGGQIMIDAIFARDYFGGSGGIDLTTFETSSKNGDNPALWDIGQGNVLGKNDIIDVAGHMFRDGPNLTTGTPSDLWFVGFINRAEPGGSAYMDFEFFVEDVWLNANPVPGDAGEGTLTSGGPQMGHTAYKFKQSTGEITKVGDFIFNTSLENGGIEPNVQIRLWVRRSDYNNVTPATFNWGPDFDGPYSGSPFGYASIIPLNNDACGIVNLTGQTTAAPPWGTKGTKDNVYSTTYNEFGVAEYGINMTAFGLDHASYGGNDPCEFPINTFIVKTRTSASFTASLKDFAGPYEWTFPSNDAVISGQPLISCDNPVVVLTVDPVRADVTYEWTTVDGNIISDPTQPTISVDKPGTYTVQSTLPTECPMPLSYVVVGFDPAKPFFNEPTATTTVSCSGNNGTINLTVSGGTSPYSFKWYKTTAPSTVISTAEDPTGLTPGDYFVEITDAIPCDITSGNFTVGARVPTSINFATTNVSCNGYNNGSIDATVTGQAPLTYAWSTGSSLEDLNGLVAGNYTLTTTDADGCTEVASTTITQPSGMTLSVSVIHDTDPNLAVSNASIDLTVSGGSPAYTYDWDHNGQESPDTDPQDLSGIPAGVYTVTVTDNNGCIAIISATIYEPEICDDGIDNDGDGLADCYDGDCGPPVPGAITPSVNPVCVGDVGVTYSITPVAGVTGYDWTVPAGAVITAGQGTTSITVTWVSSEGGQICVASMNTICIGAPSCLTVIPDDVPPIPGAISNEN